MVQKSSQDSDYEAPSESNQYQELYMNGRGLRTHMKPDQVYSILAHEFIENSYDEHGASKVSGTNSRSTP